MADRLRVGTNLGAASLCFSRVRVLTFRSVPLASCSLISVLSSHSFERSPSPITIFLSNELLVDTIYCCYTFSVSSKRSSFLDSSLSELGGGEWNFVATILKDDTDDERSLQLSNR